jgi:hypothetical protein
MTMQRHCAMGELLKFGYANSFFFSTRFFQGDGFQWWMLATVLTTLSAGFSGAIIAYSQRNALHEVYFWSARMVLSVFMMLPISKFVWELIPRLQTIQFPWRFSTVLSIAAAPLLGLGPSSYSFTRLSKQFIPLSIGYLSIAGWLLITLVTMWDIQVLGLPTANHSAALFPTTLIWKASSAKPGTGDAPEYRPIGVLSPRAHMIKSFGGTQANFAMMTHGTAKTKRLSARHIELSVETEADGTVQLRHFYYEGWTAFLAGKALLTTASKPDGLIQFSLPPGRHQIQIIFSRSQPGTPENMHHLYLHFDRLDLL